MTVQNVHSLYAAGIGGTMVGGITEVGNATNTDLRGEASSGRVYSQFSSVVSVRPTPIFSSFDVAAMYDEITMLGKDIASLAGGLALYGYAHERGATRKAGATHTRNQYLDGILHLANLRFDHQGDAILAAAALATFDGTNSPMLINHAVALPAQPTDDVRFTLRSIETGGITLGQVTGVEIDFGIGAAAESADGDIFPTFPHIRTIMPTVNITGTDLTWASPDASPADAIPIKGTPGGVDIGQLCVHANTTFYLQKRQKGGAIVPDATPEHIKITAAGIVIIDDAMRTAAQNGAEVTARMKLDFDTVAVQVPLIWNTSSAIT